MLSLIMLRMAAEADQREDIEEHQPRDDGVLVLFEPPGKMEGDAILTVGSKKIAVNKIYLSQLSDYFRALFYGNFREREKNEFVIREVDEDEFIEMLLVLLPTRKPIDENNVESLLELADRFIIESLREKCQYFLNSPDVEWMNYYRSRSLPLIRDDACVIWNAPCGEMESDTVIEVGKERKKFAVNKVYLAQHSTVFFDMFYRHRFRASSITRLTADEFESLLRVILPTHEPITYSNTEAVFKAAFRLQISPLQRECITLLTSSSRGYPVVTILRLAFRTNCDELKEYCRTRLPSQVHVDSLRSSAKAYFKYRPKSARKWLSQLYETLPKCSIPQGELERRARPRVFFDITKQGQSVGRIEMELFSDWQPRAAENFRSLCTGERGLGLSGKPLHFKDTQLYCFGQSMSSSFRETIYGAEILEKESRGIGRFDKPAYPFMLVHCDSFGTRIVADAPYDYDKSFAFGRVVEGFEEVARVAMDGAHYCTITDCGEL